jgi:MFS family permease
MFFYDWLAIPGIAGYWTVLLAYGLVGLGAAAYSPAKYGILTELLPARQLVVANGWIEGLTVISIILGTVLGGALVSPAVSSALLSFDMPMLQTGVDTPAEAAILVIAVFYLLAALFNLYIPDTGADYGDQHRQPVVLVREFGHCFMTLWRDRLSQITLAVTTLFWGAGATLQFIVLKWGEVKLGLPLDKGAILQGVTAIGIALGSVLAARLVPLKSSFRVLPLGIAMGLVVISMCVVTWMPLVYALLIAIGALAGFFVVPMNAMLQHRGHVLMSAGHSIAVQNFNENLCILVMLGLYAFLISHDVHINWIVLAFGLFVAGAMLLVKKRHEANQAERDSLHLIGIEKH